MNFDLIELLVSFAGGVFGAAIGALPVWILCGVAAIIGATISMINGDSSFMNGVTWGSFLGPHTSFAGGVAAAAYAAKIKKLDNGRDICTALIGLNNPLILLVGGLFGALGYMLFIAFTKVPNVGDVAWTNTIALSVAVNAVLVRVFFGKTGVFGKVAKGYNRFLPSEFGSWVPYQSKPGQLVMLALAVGIPASYFAYKIPASVGLVFGFAVVVLLFMQFGMKVPVTHHIALSASMITAVTGDMAWGICFAFLGAFIGEIVACLFVYHGDTHIDPPTVALVTTFTIYPILKLTGVLAITGMASFAIAAFVALLCIVVLTSLRKRKVVAVNASN